MLGPLGALALALLVLRFAWVVWQSFLAERFVSGATYQREVAKNERLLGLLEQAVGTADTLTRKDEEQTRQLWGALAQAKQPSPSGPSAPRSRSRVAEEVESLERSFERPRPGQG